MFQKHSNPHARKFASFRPLVVLLGVLIVGLFTFWPSSLTSSSISLVGPQAGGDKQQEKGADTAAGNSAEKVPVELFVMSRCPDAKFCENEFSDIFDTIPSVMAVTTQYIAQLQDNDRGVTCMHGESECLGNKYQLCLGAHVPADKNREWFVATLLCHTGGDVADVKHLESCMATAGVSKDIQDKVLACSNGEEGNTLQIKSAKEVKTRDVKKSCTVYIDGKKRCIRDGGRWYDCPGGDSTEAFLRTICDAHTAKTGSVVPECAALLPAADQAASGVRLL